MVKNITVLLAILIFVCLNTPVVMAVETFNIKAVLPPQAAFASALLPQALEYGAANFNSIYPNYAINITTISIPDSHEEPSSCTQLDAHQPADAILDLTSDSYIPHLADKYHTFYVGTNKNADPDLLQQCTMRLNPFVGVAQWALATVDLAVAAGWSRLTLVSSTSNAFAKLISSEIALLAPKFNISIGFVEFSPRADAAYWQAIDAAFDSGSRVTILIGPASTAQLFINTAITTAQGYQFQHVWLNIEENGDKSASFASSLNTTDAIASYGLLALQTVPLGDTTATSLKTALGSSQMLSEDVTLSYNALMALGQIMKAVVEAGGDKANASQLFQAAQTVSLQNMLGEFKIRGHQKVGPLYLSNLAVSSSSQRTWTSVATWLANSSYTFSMQLNSLVWFDGGNTVPTDTLPKTVVIAVASPGENPIYKQWNYAAQVALKHIKQANFLTGFDVVLHYVNSSNSGRYAAERTISSLTGSHFSAVVGGLFSDEVLSMQRVLNAYRIPQLAPIVSTPELNDKGEFPYFIRMNALFEQQVRAMLLYWKQLGYHTAALCRAASNDGLYGADAMNKAAVDNNITIITRQPFAPNAKSVLEAFALAKVSGARLVFSPARETEQSVVFPHLRAGGYMSSEWAYFLSDRSIFLDDTPNGTANAIDGLMSIGIYEGGGPVYDKFMADFNAINPQAASGKLAVGIAYIYDAVFTVAHAMKNLAAANKTIDFHKLGEQIYAAIQNVSFVGATGTVSFANGNRRNNTIPIINRVNGAWKTVALGYAPLGMLTAQSISILEDPIWIGNRSEKPLDVVGAYVAWESDAGTALSIIVALMLLCFAGAALVVIIHSENKMIHASSPPFLLYVLFGLALATVSVFTAHSELTATLCTLRVWFFVLGFAIAYGGLMIKNWRIYRLWSYDSMEIIRITNMDLALYSLVLVAPYLVVLIFWTIFDKPTLIIYPSASGSNSACSYTSSMSLAPAMVTFVLIAIMLLAGCVLAIFTRNVPHLYNECRYIALSTYALTLCVALGLVIHFVLAPISSLASYLVFSVSVVFGFGATFVAIFIPKIWIMTQEDHSFWHPSRHITGGRGSGSADSNKKKKPRNLKSLAAGELEAHGTSRNSGGKSEAINISVAPEAGTPPNTLTSVFQKSTLGGIGSDSVTTQAGSMVGLESVMKEDDRM